MAKASLDLGAVATLAGRRILIPADLFQLNRTNPFEHEKRRGAICFPFRGQSHDEQTLRLPFGWRVESLPASQEISAGALTYRVEREMLAGAIHLVRHFRRDGVLFDPSDYRALRNFYSKVGASDEEQIVLQRGTSP